MQTAIILCGGKGTRLHPLTHEIPKPMLLIKGKPVLHHQIHYLMGQGISTIYLAVSHLKEQIMDYFKDGSEFGVNIKYIFDEYEGTGGALRNLKYLNFKESVLVMNGDTILYVDVNDMTNYHINCHSEQVTIAVSENLVSAGLYIIEPEVFNLIPEGFCSLENDVFPLLKQSFYLYDGDWFDMGTMGVYEEMR